MSVIAHGALSPGPRKVLVPLAVVATTRMPIARLAPFLLRVDILRDPGFFLVMIDKEDGELPSICLKLLQDYKNVLGTSHLVHLIQENCVNWKRMGPQHISTRQPHPTGFWINLYPSVYDSKVLVDS